MTTTQPKIEGSLRAEYATPVSKDQIASFLNTVPDHAFINVVEVKGGSQRDPYTVALRFVANWDAS